MVSPAFRIASIHDQIETFLDTAATTSSSTAVGGLTTCRSAGTVHGQATRCPQPPP